MRFVIFFLLLISLRAVGQEIKVEFDKKHDVSRYKTFKFGESKVVTTNDDKQVTNATIDKWIRKGIKRELEYKGLTEVDSTADLLVTYALVSSPRLDIQAIGPAGMTPGSNDRTWSRDYTETSLIIDLNNKSNFLVWRINANADVMGSSAERTIDLIVVKGFKKFRKAAKKK
ncbi:MAG: DUF4136 domain-containing protein [Bacteroidetes bacterium]|nr:DUF4136 domain-containing protein [Bacteroidota bacterium]